jgi:hypothetical protein
MSSHRDVSLRQNGLRYRNNASAASAQTECLRGAGWTEKGDADRTQIDTRTLWRFKPFCAQPRRGKIGAIPNAIAL